MLYLSHDSHIDRRMCGRIHPMQRHISPRLHSGPSRYIIGIAHLAVVCAEGEGKIVAQPGACPVAHFHVTRLRVISEHNKLTTELTLCFSISHFDRRFNTQEAAQFLQAYCAGLYHRATVRPEMQ